MKNDVPSDKVLDETPAKALRFLGAISSRAEIRAAISGRRGYTEEDHQQGWSLTLAASGYRTPASPSLETPAAAAAIVEIDNWDEPNFRAARAALGTFPEQQTFVFQDLEAQTGAAAVASVTTFLDRVDELESGKGRKDTKKEDAAAMKKLAARGITPEERARMRKLLNVALGSPSEPVKDPSVKSPAAVAQAAKIRDAKIALRVWYDEWSEMARIEIKRRDYLISMGLATRKDLKKGTKKDPAPAAGGAPGNK